MTIESDFYATEAGRKHFSDQLTSIRCEFEPPCPPYFVNLTCACVRASLAFFD